MKDTSKSAILEAREIVQKVTAMLVVFVMILAEFSLVGSYAIDAVLTNNENVEFVAYFENTEGEKVKEISSVVGTEGLKLKVDISVGNRSGLGGYFDGTISLRDANFKLKEDIGEIHVDAGNTQTIEREIEFVNKKVIESGYMNMESLLEILGIYKNSKKDYDITGEASVKVNWVSEDDISSSLTAKILTNSTYKVEEANKKLVQVLVESKIENNAYPVKETKIELSVPYGVEEVKVHKRTTLATNGDKDFGESNYSYNAETRMLTINVENTEDDANIAWAKNAKDTFVVSYIYGEDVNLEGREVAVNSTITTLDEKELKAERAAKIEEEKDGIVTTSIGVKEASIYKGKIYTGEERDYETETIVNIDYAEAVESLKITENKPVFVAEKEATEDTEASKEEKTANIETAQTKVNKAEFIKIFGESGFITIQDQEGNVVGNITKDSETDEEGNVVVKYSSGVTKLTIETSKPQTNGILRLNHTKKILDSKLEREEVKELVGIKNSAKVEFTKISTEIDSAGSTNVSNENTDKKMTTGTAVANKEIKLKETESKASVSLENKTLSVSEDEQDLQMTVVLDSSDESKDLYKNPTITITLPSQITSMTAKCKILYGNGLEIEKATATKVDGKEVITIKLKGEQEKYPEEAVNGARILVYAKVKLDELSTNATEEICVNYTNEYTDKQGECKTEVKIVSENKMILTNNIEAYGVTTVGDEGTKEISLDINAESQDATVEMQVINNEETEISDVTILGSLPVSEDNITRTSEIQTNVNAEIYYTTVENPSTDLGNSENGWTTVNSEEATSYMVVIDELEQAEIVSLSYDISVEEDLDYGVYEEASYSVSYMNAMSNNVLKANATTLSLSTGETVEVSQKVTATVGGENLDENGVVYVGEIITYTVEVENTGKIDIEGATFTANIPNSATLVEVNEDFQNYESEGDYDEAKEEYFVEKTDSEFKVENISLSAGKKIKYTYSILINKNVEENTELQNVTTFICGDFEDSKTVSYIIKSAKVKLELNTVQAGARYNNNGAIEAREAYYYQLKVKNLTEEKLENIKLTIKSNEMLTIEEVYDIDKANDEKEESFGFEIDETGTITIDEIEASETKHIMIIAIVKAPTDDLSSANIWTTALDQDGNVYRSNIISETVEGAVIDFSIEADVNTSDDSGIIRSYDVITYTITAKNTGKEDIENLEIRDTFSWFLNLESVTLNGKECEYEKDVVFIVDDEEVQWYYLIIETPLAVGETAEIVIKAEVDLNYVCEMTEVPNKAVASERGTQLAETEKIVFYLEPNYLSNTYVSSGSDDGNEDTDSSGNSKDMIIDYLQSINTYSIAGRVYLDENSNGSMDSGEQAISGIRVYLFDVTSNSIAKDSSGNEISATTNTEGKYTISNIYSGTYLVVFEYDTGKYGVTVYKADGVSESKNSNVIKSIITVNGEKKEVATTDKMTLTSSCANINMGLIEIKTFDLELKKTVSKITITNKSGTTTKVFDDTDLAKVEIAAKYLSGSNVVIEYKIKIKNNGNDVGYVKNIVDYMPASLSFSSSMNSDWYKQGDYLYNSSLANTKIGAGETKELTLILTKKMTESNTGVINNRAEIAKAESLSGLDDIDSTPGNIERGEDDFSSADVIIGVKTGAAITYISLILIIIVLIIVCAYLINKKVFNFGGKEE